MSDDRVIDARGYTHMVQRAKPHHAPLEPTMRALRDAFAAAFHRFQPMEPDAVTRAVFHLDQLPARTDEDGKPICCTLNVRYDFDPRTAVGRSWPGSTNPGIIAMTSVADCLLPWIQHGDIQFIAPMDAGDGDVVLFNVPPHANSDYRYSFATKVLHRYRERLLLLSNDPPAHLSQSLQQRVHVAGVVVAYLRYASPAPRPPDAQRMQDKCQQVSRAEGIDWSADFLSEMLGHPVSEEQRCQR